VDESIPYLERLRKAIRESSFVLRSRDRRRKQAYDSKLRIGSKTNAVSVTVSIGVADRNGRDMTPQQVVKAADQALYQAKKAGRNRIHA
jgi:diguanylate cyclase (GGDEF)-like protein